MSDDEDDLPEAVSDESPADTAAVEPETYRRKQRAAERRDMDRAVFWKGLLSDSVGRQELWRVLSDAHFDEEKFGAGPNGFPDPLNAWFHAGEQAFGYRLFLTLLRADRNGVVQMLEEHDHRLQKPASRRRKAEL